MGKEHAKGWHTVVLASADYHNERMQMREDPVSISVTIEKQLEDLLATVEQAEDQLEKAAAGADETLLHVSDR